MKSTVLWEGGVKISPSEGPALPDCIEAHFCVYPEVCGNKPQHAECLSTGLNSQTEMDQVQW